MQTEGLYLVGEWGSGTDTGPADFGLGRVPFWDQRELQYVRALCEHGSPAAVFALLCDRTPAGAKAAKIEGGATGAVAALKALTSRELERDLLTQMAEAIWEVWSG